MNVKQLIYQFDKITKNVDWKALRKEQGIRHDMNFKRNLLIRYLVRKNVSVKEIVEAAELKYPQHRQIIYDVRDSEYSAYTRVEKQLGLLKD